MRSVTRRAMSALERATYAASKKGLPATVVLRYLGGRPRLGTCPARAASSWCQTAQGFRDLSCSNSLFSSRAATKRISHQARGLRRSS